jgi:hypothetical protein
MNGIRERKRQRKLEELERKKRDAIDLSGYLSFEEAFEYLEISRRSFATIVGGLKLYWEVFDSVMKERSQTFLTLGLAAMNAEGRAVEERFGKGAKDFPKPVRVMRRYYFERSKLTRFKALQRGQCPLP